MVKEDGNSVGKSGVKRRKNDSEYLKIRKKTKTLRKESGKSGNFTILGRCATTMKIFLKYTLLSYITDSCVSILKLILTFSLSK